MQACAQCPAAVLRFFPSGFGNFSSAEKIGAKTWFEVHTTAHRLGIPTNATMLYGHIETFEERIVHMMKLREAQDETGGFLSFIPLAFQPGVTGIKPKERVYFCNR